MYLHRLHFVMPASIYLANTYRPLPLNLPPNSDRRIAQFLLEALADSKLTKDLSICYDLSPLDVLALKGVMFDRLPLQKDLFDIELVSQIFWRTQLLIRAQLREAGFLEDPLIEPAELWTGPKCWDSDVWEKRVSYVVSHHGFQPGKGF